MDRAASDNPTWSRLTGTTRATTANAGESTGTTGRLSSTETTPLAATICQR